jgi:hypothetical protein
MTPGIGSSGLPFGTWCIAGTTKIDAVSGDERPIAVDARRSAPPVLNTARRQMIEIW